MARTTAAEVITIMDDDNLDTDLVNACVTGANALVTKVFQSDTSLGDTLLEEIERWISAHMVSCTPAARVSKKEGAGGAFIEYTGKFEKNLGATPYGQTAMGLDFTGKLAALGNQAASFTAIKEFD